LPQLPPSVPALPSLPPNWHLAGDPNGSPMAWWAQQIRNITIKNWCVYIYIYRYIYIYGIFSCKKQIHGQRHGPKNFKSNHRSSTSLTKISTRFEEST
jgi:hypothetical protein